MKNIFFMLSILLLCFSSIIKLNAAKTYNGTAVPLIKSTISSGMYYVFNGIFDHVARVGQIIKPGITDIQGNVIEEGTLLRSVNSEYWAENVVSAENKVKSSEANLIKAAENYNRFKSLSNQSVVSKKIYQDIQMAYYTALANNDSYKADLLESQRFLQAQEIRAPFEGIVDKVYAVKGEPVFALSTLEISQLNPIGVKVIMPRNEANKIKSNTPVKITFQDGEKKKGVFHGQSMLCDDGIIFITSNKPRVDKDLTLNRKSIPLVKCCYYVAKFFVDDPLTMLAVPAGCLHKDKAGYYVWKGKNQRYMQPGRGMDTTFSVEKVYVIPDNMQRIHAGFDIIKALKNPGILREYDLILLDVPEGLKNNDKVCYPQERYELMAGDKVKVVIDNLKV